MKNAPLRTPDGSAIAGKGPCQDDTVETEEKP